MENNWSSHKLQIDNWINGLSEEAALRVWKVFGIIEQEEQVLGGHFKIPIEKFDSNKIPMEDRRSVLLALDDKKTLSVLRSIGRSRDGMIGIARSIQQEPEIIEWYDTYIEINWQPYRYFQESIRKIIEPLNKSDAGEKPTTSYRVTFNEHNREVKVNDILIAKPDFDSENEVVFDYIYKHPNLKIKTKDIERDKRITIQKRLTDILRDLGFNGSLRKVFFKGISKTSLHFVNPVTKEYAQKNNLPQIDSGKLKKYGEK